MHNLADQLDGYEDDRAQTAYDAYRNGFSRGHVIPPPWNELDSWMRDALIVTYLQGKLDGPKERDEWCAEYVKVRDEAASLRLTLKDANEVCRSAYQIASRAGKETNWSAFTSRVGKSLELQHTTLLGSK